jgi:uncharacterized protein (UPF0332 family)
MTDKDTLFLYRLNQAEDTLADAEKMVESGFSSRSIVNRANYAMFYAVLSLFLKSGVNIQTSKHSGIISIFRNGDSTLYKLQTSLQVLLDIGSYIIVSLGLKILIRMQKSLIS